MKKRAAPKTQHEVYEAAEALEADAKAQQQAKALAARVVATLAKRKRPRE